MKTLYKTKIVIWTDFDPTGTIELDDLASEAVRGDAYCSSMHAEKVDDPSKDEDWDGTEFFGEEDDEGEDAQRQADEPLEPPGG